MSTVTQKVTKVLNEKMVQLALVAGVLFYIVANPALFDFVRGIVEKLLAVVNIKVTFDGTKLLVLHSLVFAVLFYVSEKFLLRPVIDMIKKVVPGGPK